MPAYIHLYRQSQGRIMSLVNNENANLPVPACPGWTVRNTLSHLLGVIGDLSNGRLENASTDEWAQGHIEKAGDRSLSDLVAEWHLRGTTNPGTFQSLGAVLVADCVTHEFDIKGAIGNKQGRDLQVVRSIALFYLSALERAWEAEGVPPLRFITETKPLDVGGENPEASVEMSWWEIGRLVSGRRSVEQAASLPWHGDASRWLDHLFVFGPREEPLEE